MIVVYGYGKEPMVLLTNKQVRKKDEVLSILKAYILRWRIEEMFRVQKNELKLESIRVRSLKKLKLMFFMISAIITYMSLKVEKQNIFFHRVVDRARSIKSIHHIKMFLYRFIAGMKEILKKDTKGVKHFKCPERRNRTQLVLTL